MSDNRKGILKGVGDGLWGLYDTNLPFNQTMDQIIISTETIKKYGLVEGAEIDCILEKENSKHKLVEVNTIAGLNPEDFKKRITYKELTPINPVERFCFKNCTDKVIRIIDLISPIAKGTRGLVVSPPKAGKTTILERVANAIVSNSNTRVIVLLIDERPEEVTHFKRNVNAEVFASNSDQSVEEHINLVEFVLKLVTVELECGRDIAVLVDSLTRMGRVFNVKGSGTGRIMSGGMESGAMEIPRRFLGVGRKIENGGSVTIIATVLVDTGSRMDQLIFEEFKGTGNSEIVLDRQLAESRIFPAIDIYSSGTRRDELMYTDKEYEKINNLRRSLLILDKKERILKLKDIMKRYPKNSDLLDDMS